MLGTKREARKARAIEVPSFVGEEDQDAGEFPEDLLPKGWGFLGSGADRAVFRAPSGVAYKVDIGCYEEYSNKAEASAWEQLRTRAPSAVPEYHLWDLGEDGVVIAVEYVPHELNSREAGEFDRWLAQERGVVVNDSGAGNPKNMRRRDDGSLVVTDCSRDVYLKPGWTED